MSTDFSKPIVTDAYATLLPGVVAAHLDLARQLEPTLTGTSTNVPTGAVRWNASTIRWERYNGASWVTLPSAGDNVYAISISGNAATATKLATARTIGGVEFDGTANINLPGVNAAGTQNTSGTAATATIAYNALGVGQTIQNVTSSRNRLVAYTNSSNRTITVILIVFNQTQSYSYFHKGSIAVNSIFVANQAFYVSPNNSSGSIAVSMSAIVPPSSTYLIDCSAGDFTVLEIKS